MPPLLFTWLEPYGIGGHALLTHNGSRTGCLECLYTLMPGDDVPEIYDRSAFAAGGQHFARNISGCAAVFIPFGAVHATRTASLAVELTLAALIGRVRGNQLVSWKGDATAFLEAGYQLSQRYNVSTEGLDQQRDRFYNPVCPVCGQGKHVGHAAR